jgi:hypothetical protein
MEKTKVDRTGYVYVTFDAKEIVRILKKLPERLKSRERTRAGSTPRKPPNKGKA